MEKGIEIITVHLKNTDGLGLKIIFAKNKVNMEYYAVITEVNPFGICGKEQIAVGDILLCFDGINIDSYETLQKLSTHNSENNKTNQPIQLKIKKGAAFEITGLYSACLNSPCSDVCKIIEEWKPKVIPRKTIDNKIDLSRKTLSRQNDSKFNPDDLSPLKKSSIDDSRKHSVDNIKFTLQKAVPMRRKENTGRSYKATLKPKKSFRNNIIPPAQPTFINRKFNQTSDQVTNLKESKSLSNLNNENVDHSKQDSLSDSSSCDSSDTSSNELTNKFVPKNKTGFDNSSSENPIDLKNNTNELEKSKRLSRSMDLLLLDLKQHPHVQNNKKKYDENILPS